jgi:glutaryl-CoA dehydrogenase
LRIVQNADILLSDVRVAAAFKLANANSFRDNAAVLRLTRAEAAWAAVGKKIDSHRLIQERYARMLGNITSSIALCTRVSAMLDEGIQKDEHAALAKEFACSRMR